MSISIKKSACEKYTLRSRDPHWWAVIMISEDGFVSIQSDYGEYSYNWQSIGEQTIKEFLISCDKGYITNKFGGQLPKEFNIDKTRDNIKKDILEKRKGYDLSEEEARVFWDTCDTLHASDKNDFLAAMEDSTFHDRREFCLLDLYDGDISSVEFVMEDSFQLKSFMNEIWPEFIGALKQELKVCD